MNARSLLLLLPLLLARCCCYWLQRWYGLCTCCCCCISLLQQPVCPSLPAGWRGGLQQRPYVGGRQLQCWWEVQGSTGAARRPRYPVRDGWGPCYRHMPCGYWYR
jgi:hypothetical protein